MTLAKLLEFVDHRDNCDFLQPMWHKGPCNCGLFALFESLDARVPLHVIGDVMNLIKEAPAFQRWKNRGEHER